MGPHCSGILSEGSEQTDPLKAHFTGLNLLNGFSDEPIQHIRLRLVDGGNRGVSTTHSIHLTCLVGLLHHPIQPQAERFVDSLNSNILRNMPCYK